MAAGVFEHGLGDRVRVLPARHNHAGPGLIEQRVDELHLQRPVQRAHVQRIGRADPCTRVGDVADERQNRVEDPSQVDETGCGDNGPGVSGEQPRFDRLGFGRHEGRGTEQDVFPVLPVLGDLQGDGSQAVFAAADLDVGDLVPEAPAPTAVVRVRVDGEVEVFFSAHIGTDEVDQPVRSAQHDLAGGGLVQQQSGVETLLGRDGADVAHSLVPQSKQWSGVGFGVDHLAAGTQVVPCADRIGDRIRCGYDHDDSKYCGMIALTEPCGLVCVTFR